MICIVLAAGYATRMYPLTESFPKSLLEVQGKSILNWLLEDIDRIEDVERIIIVSNHKFLQHFTEWKTHQRLTKPVDLLDDGSMTNETRVGAVKDILVAVDSLGKAAQEALVIAGDNLLEFSFQGFVDFYKVRKRSCIMCYTEPDVALQRRTGIITINSEHLVTSFEEKPAIPKSDLAVPPFYIYTDADIARIPTAIADGCSTDAPGSSAAWMSRYSEVYAWLMPGKRYDIGSIDGYKEVQTLFRPFIYR